MTFLLVLSVLIYRGDIPLCHAMKGDEASGSLPKRALWHQKSNSLRSLTATTNLSIDTPAQASARFHARL